MDRVLAAMVEAARAGGEIALAHFKKGGVPTIASGTALATNGLLYASALALLRGGPVGTGHSRG